MKRNVIILVVILVLLIAAAIFVFVRGGAGGDRPIGKDEKNAIRVQDQNPGSSIILDKVLLEKPGFVAIYEADGKKLGKLVGISQFLTSGENESVFVYLDAKSGSTFYAKLFEDNGDMAFSESTDKEILDAGNDPIQEKFSVK